MSRRRLVMVVSVSLLVAAWLGVAYLFDPLVHGSTRGYGDFEYIPSEEPFSDAVGLVYVHEHEGVVMMSIRNRGWFPVTVRNVNAFPSGEFRSLLKQNGVMIESVWDPANAIGTLDEPVPLPEERVTIRPGEDRELGVAVRFEGCEWHSAGGSQGFETMQVEYSVLGLPRAPKSPYPSSG